MDGAGFDVQQEQELFVYSELPRSTLGAHPAPYSMMYLFFSLGLGEGGRKPEQEVDHLRPSSAEVKNEWSYTSTSLMPSLACRRKTLPLSIKCLLLYFSAFVCILNVLECNFKICQLLFNYLALTEVLDRSYMFAVSFPSKQYCISTTKQSNSDL